MAVQLEVLSQLSNFSTATQISSVATLSSVLIIQNPSSNTSKIHFGRSDVATNKSIEIDPGSYLSITAPSIRGIEEALILSDYYILTTAASQICNVVYISRR